MRKSWKKSRKLVLGIAVALGCSMASVAFAAEDGLVFNNSITGDISKDTEYAAAGVIDASNGVYNFKKDTTINSNTGDMVRPPSGYASGRIIAPIKLIDNTKLSMNMNNNTLNIYHHDVLAEGKANALLPGMTAIKGSTLEINNAGKINVSFESAAGYEYGILAQGGSKVIIHNGGDNQENRIFSFNGLDASKSKDGIFADTRKSDSGEETKIVIDGLVSIVSRNTPYGSGIVVSNAISADSAQIDIGGGKIIGRLNTTHKYNYGDVTQININMKKDAEGNVVGAGDNIVQLEGDVNTSSVANANRINIGLNGSDSYFKGNVIGYDVTNADKYAGDSAADGMTNHGVNIFMDNAANWTGDAKGVLTLRMHNGATWYGGSNAVKDSEKVNRMSMTVDTGAEWHHAGTSDINVDYFTGGKDEATRGTIVMDSDKDITLNNYSGNTVVSFNRDSEYPTRVLGGDITIGSAAEGSVFTLSTDNNGIDTSNISEVSKVLSKLANKLTYTGAIEGAENNLDGYAQIAEGLTASSAALKLGDISFSAEDGKGSLKDGSIITPENKKNPAVIYGDKETAMMKGAKTAMASAALLWRAENNDLMKRMGDLRLSEGENGIWAKYYGGKYSMDEQNTDMNLKYNAYQVGYDKEVGNGWKAGVALSYNDGNSTYGNGRADIKGTSLGLYGTWNGDDGQYLDLIAKCTRLENEYDVRNLYGHKLSGDYKTWGASLSAEYGKRFEGKNGMYVDPSVELTVGRVASKDYTAASDYLDALGKAKNLDVEQDAFTSCIGRLGVRVGQNTDNASYYVKLAAAHEFSGDFDSSYRVPGEPGGSTSIDFGDTWVEAQVGLTAKLSAANTFYATYGCSFGGDVEQKYRLDAGLRWSF